MTYAVFILVAVGGLVWLACRRPRPRRWLLPHRAVVPRAVAAVDRQHRHLQAGGLLGETTCEQTKTHFRELLTAGRADDIERELRPGLDFAVQVRALAEIGGPDAADVLERQLARPLCADPVEQSWYWLDVAAGLRRMNRTEALPSVLRCTDAAAGLPPGAMLAAEAVAFPGFATALKYPVSVDGRSALRALVATSRAAREGIIDLAGVVRAGLGDLLADVSARAESGADPWLAAAVIEAERVFRRLGHWVRLLPADARALAERQAMRLWATGERRLAWLAGVADRMLSRFAAAGGEEQGAILRGLFELRADVTRLFPHLPDRRAAWWADAARALRWSKSPAAGPVLAGLALRLVRKERTHARAAVVLGALRGHACHESERALLRAAAAPHPTIRAAAAGSLGWWPPHDPDRVVRALRVARTDPDADIRRAAVAALARLGERAALTEVAAGLHSEETGIRTETAARIATEELTWLWPDLETAALSDDADSALAAGEALEQLRERLFGFAE
ncbi:MAG: HEAT repeat domain-containing protein [Planctomycetes bacterium]|nr:HEAT repeat domain-containing protein [Planctomycetota bacterium]